MYGYNGFGKAVQDASTKWMFAQIKAGILPEYPKKCECCGQTEGKIGYHAESYAVPFGPHIVAFDVCHLCHVMIHADRHKTHIRSRVVEYGRALQAGRRFENFRTFDWRGAKAKYLASERLPPPTQESKHAEATHNTDLFHQLIVGAYNPEFDGQQYWAPPHKIELFA